MGAPQSRPGTSLTLCAGFASGPATPTCPWNNRHGRKLPFGVCSMQGSIAWSYVEGADAFAHDIGVARGEIDHGGGLHAADAAVDDDVHGMFEPLPFEFHIR